MLSKMPTANDKTSKAKWWYQGKDKRILKAIQIENDENGIQIRKGQKTTVYYFDISG